ncbi:MAG: SRPBCC family protein, partial [Bacteroidia bacterium]
KTNEKAIAGVTSGLVKLNDSITWQAKHLGFEQHLTSKITAYEKPISFTDEMTKGIFKKLHHQHLFKFENNQTVMTDIFEFEAPLGLLGRIAEKLFLTNYMRHFLTKRNAFLEKVAEEGDWQKYI